MTLSVAAAVGLLLFAWAAVSGLLGRRSITGPLIFAVAGYVLANPDWGPLPVDVETGLVHGLTEITLALVLFADAARVKIGELRRDAAVPGRLLGIGLPLCLLVGTLLAAALLDLPFALALLVGAALAPTDAALSGPIIA
ncbi:MAG TPA: cation:proton antiporter, partial [Acidimicrobiales bacterium]|nr:cation:proton antiporter [Acidimicrobiales bacterium]